MREVETSSDPDPAAGRMDVPQSVLPRSYLQGCLQLLLCEAPGHGYELVTRLADLGIRSRDKGLVYRALREMEADGLVVSHWEPSAGGPVRRTYRLVSPGAIRLVELTDALRDAERAIGAFLDRFDALAIRPRDAAA